WAGQACPWRMFAAGLAPAVVAGNDECRANAPRYTCVESTVIEPPAFSDAGAPSPFSKPSQNTSCDASQSDGPPAPPATPPPPSRVCEKMASVEYRIEQEEEAPATTATAVASAEQHRPSDLE